MKRKRLQFQPRSAASLVVGIAWYRPEQWEELRRWSSDRASLEDSYDEWLTDANGRLHDLKHIGYLAQPVDVDVYELVAWCRTNGRKVDGAARSAFVAEKVQAQYKGKDAQQRR